MSYGIFIKNKEHEVRGKKRRDNNVIENYAVVAI